MGGPKEPALTVCMRAGEHQPVPMAWGQPAPYQSALDLQLRHRCSRLPSAPVHLLCEGSKGTAPCTPVRGECRSVEGA